MSGMFWIALELSIPKTRFIMSSLTVQKLDAFNFDGVAESDNTVYDKGLVVPRVGCSPNTESEQD